MDERFKHRCVRVRKREGFAECLLVLEWADGQGSFFFSPFFFSGALQMEMSVLSTA
ncbi:MAG: hypothetical protein ACRC4N_05935 [Gammaproteobacteria bacterium]